eukprot:NODE_480_length_7860_cov_0.165958.p5 type:complete len:122 gc:universal NODE_480_length_7860_cov_0.165958:1628-1263(-)
MDINNISTVIAPNILYSKSKEGIKEDSLSAIQTVTSLLIWQDDFWLIPVEIAALMNESTEGMTEKDLLKKCEVIVKNTKPQDHVRKGDNNVENKLVIFDEDTHTTDNNITKNSSATTISES